MRARSDICSRIMVLAALRRRRRRPRRYQGPAARRSPVSAIPHLHGRFRGPSGGARGAAGHVPGHARTQHDRADAPHADVRRCSRWSPSPSPSGARACSPTSSRCRRSLAAGGVALLVAALAMLRTISPLVAVQADLQVRYEAAVADALNDPLTGLGNHRAFQEELDRQVEGAVRYGVPLSLLLIDLDEFKQVNDSARPCRRRPRASRLRAPARGTRCAAPTAPIASVATNSPSSCPTPISRAPRSSRGACSPRRCSRRCATRT